MIFLIALQLTLLVMDSSAASQTGLWKFATNPTEWKTQDFIKDWLGITAALTSIGIIVGVVIGIKTDFMILAAAIPGLVGLAAPPMINLSNVVGRGVGGLACDLEGLVWIGCQPAVLVVGLLVGTMAVYFVFTLIEWWRGRD